MLSYKMLMNHSYDSYTNSVLCCQIWDTLRQGDLGCSPGGGKNSMGVFMDAGLNFQSSFSEASDNSQGNFFCI